MSLHPAGVPEGGGTAVSLCAAGPARGCCGRGGAVCRNGQGQRHAGPVEMAAEKWALVLVAVKRVPARGLAGDISPSLSTAGTRWLLKMSKAPLF